MCGLIFVLQRNDKPAVKKVRKLYHAQISRGRAGYGYVEIDGRNVGEFRRARFEAEIFSTLSKSKARSILFHHRIPTSTPNTPTTAHPIPLFNKKLKFDYYGEHNGMISNDKELKKAHEKDGFTYVTELKKGVFSESEKICYFDDSGATVFNDSEALIIDLAQAIENGAEKIESKGSIAFIILQVEKGTNKAVKLYFGRNDRNPLKIDLNKDHIKLSSCGTGDDVEPHKLHCYDYATGEITVVRDLQIGDKYVAVRAATVYPKSDNTGWEYGKTWNAETLQYEWPKVKKDEMGFTTRHVHQAVLPIPKPRIQEIPEDEDIDLTNGYTDPSMSNYTSIPGYIEQPLHFRTSEGMQEFWCVEELDESYANLLEEIEFWNDSIKSATERKDAKMVEDYKAHLSILLSDEITFKNEIRRIYPKDTNPELLESFYAK